jgi:hypothetical protein
MPANPSLTYSIALYTTWRWIRFIAGFMAQVSMPDYGYGAEGM